MPGTSHQFGCASVWEGPSTDRCGRERATNHHPAGGPDGFLRGGTADAARVETAFGIILKDPNVKAILVNIFGGIVRCDRVAQGIVDAYNNMGDISIPIIVRLQGTNAEIAKEIIDNCDFKVFPLCGQSIFQGFNLQIKCLK